MNSLKIMKTICILLSSQSILCTYNSSLAAAGKVNSKPGIWGLNLPVNDPKMAFLVGFIERNQESYFNNNNHYQNVTPIGGYLVGDARCTETNSGCGVCNIYKNNDPLRYRLCQWGYNINWPFSYYGNGGVDREGGNVQVGGGTLISDINAFQADTSYSKVRWMWGKRPNSLFNQPSAMYGGCTKDKPCWTYIINSQANSMNCMKGNGTNCWDFNMGGSDITPAEIQANFP